MSSCKMLSCKKFPHLVFWVFALFFVGKGIDRIAAFGDQPLGHATGDIEILVDNAAKIFAQQGLGPTVGLPVYPDYPILSEIPKLKENHVYPHQFPGSEYVLAAFYKVFGISLKVFQWGRLFPLLTLFFSILFFINAASRNIFNQNAQAKMILGVLLFILPAFGHWALQWAGQSYISSLVLLAFGVSLNALASRERSVSWRTALVFVLIGFLSMYMHLPYCFILCLTPFIAASFLSEPETKLKGALTASFLIGLGLSLAFATRLIQLAVYLESFSLALTNQFEIAKLRSTGVMNGEDATRIMLIGQYSAHVARFFNVGAISMALYSLFFIWLSKRNENEKKHLVMGVALAFLASYVWVFVMKNFAIHHTHFHPRSFLILYLVLILMTARLVQEKVVDCERA